MYRFIPTYMGNAPFRAARWLPYTVHPHVHGERGLFPGSRRSTDGSSPRTWGTLSRSIVAIDSGRFIPTYMGNACNYRR